MTWQATLLVRMQVEEVLRSIAHDNGMRKAASYDEWERLVDLLEERGDTERIRRAREYAVDAREMRPVWFAERDWLDDLWKALYAEEERLRPKVMFKDPCPACGR